MTISLILPMIAFAIAASISPGPVNLVCLSSGSRYPLSKGLIFVTGATLGFIALFITIGMGLYSVLSVVPGFNAFLRWAGVTFLLYLSFLLFRDDGRLPEDEKRKAPGFITGVIMQWVNPKAWLASASGIGAYTSGHDLHEVIVFATLYMPICWLSLSCWVYAGVYLRRYVQRPIVLVTLNRVLAFLLAASCIYLLIE
ncbi:LysE family translocator [Shewanella mesophila]|uniref:LysE family translocator n=1 Tax=Shewanella mesophila TaxID=2864208 RepID=UPI001C65771A|nr:LysE family translocator [Shewanella mesophila]QYJ86923.1 LysE family translocator [Shewanella mesophila]